MQCHAALFSLRLPIVASVPAARHPMTHFPALRSKLPGRRTFAASLSDSNGRPPAPALRRGAVYLSGRAGLDPFRGKPGCVSFYGVDYQSMEARELVSSPFADGDRGSLLWLAAPVALIASLAAPQFFLANVLEAVLSEGLLAEIVTAIASEIIFYIGLATFLSVTDKVQRPYLDFSPKRWSLITGLRGYLSSAFFVMGFKVFAPLFAAYVIWPSVGIPAFVAVAPFLLGCAAQYAFEIHAERRGMSCWPLIPIIFELYRLYQLNKGAHFIERMLIMTKSSSAKAAAMDRAGAFVSMLAVLQIVGLVCLWSLATFLMRLFPSRPVAENY